MTSTRVQVALYDLSGGMAGQLSAPLLGGPEHAIEIIPHTGILAFGREYFFGGGGGISAEDPGYFRSSRGIAPIQIIDLGTTLVSQLEFEGWCVQQMRGGSYAGTAYDLFHRNCNHFSHDAALKGLRLSKGVPQFVLEVPQKVLASPMGQMMQPMLQGMQVGGGSTFVPTGTSMGGSGGASSRSAAAAAEQPNPWASTTTSSSSTNKRSPPSTPLLDKHNRPLLSTDTKTVVLCASKFDHDAIRTVADLIASRQTVPRDVLAKACDALLAALMEGSQLTFGFMLLRLFVLHDYSTWKESQKCLEWTREQLLTNNNSTPGLSPAARSMAWCTMSNAVATTLLNMDDKNAADLLDAAIQDTTTSPRPEVKQAAVSFLYNVAVVGGKNTADEPQLSDLDVSLLCGCMEGIQDATTRKNCLLAVGHLLSSHKKSVAAQLMVDLGLDQSLHTVDGDKDLANEIVALIDYAIKS